MPLPPWLDIRPEQFVRAMQAGTVAGQAAARAAQAQWEEEQRLKLEERRMQAQKEQSLAQMQGLQAYRLGELGVQKERLGIARQHESNLLNRPESPIGKLQYDRTAAISKGDTGALKEIDAAIAEATTNKGRSIYVGQDDQGRPIFQLSEGGAKPIGIPTVATQSLAQSKNLQYQNATELLSWLEKHVKPEHVGLAGKTGEFVVDKTLGQLLPEVANKDRIDVRSTLDMAQGLAREIVDSPAGRFSNVERDAVLGALPSTGVFESYPDAIARIQRAKEVLRNRGRVYSTELGQPVPPWAMSKEQIKQKYQQGKTSGISPTDPKFKAAGFLTEDQALDALQRFY